MTDPNDCGVANGTVLVRLRATVLERDENYGGWLAVSPSGCLSTVSIVKLPPRCSSNDGPPPPLAEKSKSEFVICGYRNSDQTLVFRCVLEKDFEYHKVMPTFHNWMSGGKKVGLIFQTAADGRAFDRGIKSVILELSQVPGCDLTTLPALDTENDVFMAVDLPFKADGRKPSPEPTAASHHHPHLHHVPPPRCSVNAIPAPRPPSPMKQPAYDDQSPDKGTSRHKRCESLDSLKKSLRSGHGTRSDDRSTCKYCRERYAECDNGRGQCEYAPDCVKTCIDCVTCIPCARGVMYHCMHDSEENFGGGPCECGDEVNTGCKRKWMLLGLLSLFLPCLWCYPPLKLCHLCGAACGVCGRKHQPDK